MKITTLLVSHNGARWLPQVLDGLVSGTTQADQVVAVDTGSTDDSVALVATALGTTPIEIPEDSSYAAALRAGLEAAGPAEPGEWVWLLHDDSNPAPDCLAVLKRAAEEAPDRIAVLGPKLREWPSLKRLLEVGVTLTGTGQRETWLERGEYDQGQHDQVHEVLAVNTAGMLVRRDVLQRIGFDAGLPLFGNDIDFGWRLAQAGYATQVVPDAVVFHVEAATRGLRESHLAEHPRRERREAALYTLLVNSPGRSAPLRSIRLVLGGLLRALGLLLVRAPVEARDEIAALAAVFLHPGRIRAARAGRPEPVVEHAEVKHLLAPFWLPYRHGLDFLGGVGAALGDTLRDAAARRATHHNDGVRPVRRHDPDDNDGFDTIPQELGLFGLLVRNPLVWAFVVSLVLALIAGRDLLTGPPMHGGALLATPDSIGHWWQAWGSGTHSLGAGTDAVAPAYLLPLAVAGTLTFGQPALLITLLFVFSVPLTMFSALRFFGRVTSGTWSPLWGGAAYALVPLLSGALHQGRLGTVVGALVLPWVATAALGLASPDNDRRWRATWRTAAGLALLVAFVPIAWFVALALVLVAPLLGECGTLKQRLAVVVAPLVMVLPWVVETLRQPGVWLVEAGRAAAITLDPNALDLALGRGTGPGSAPWWISVGLPVAAVVALVRGDTRSRVVRAWIVAGVAALGLVVTSRVLVSLPGIPDGFRAWPGFLLVLLAGAFILAAVIAGDGAVRVAGDAGFGWRQPIAGLAFLAAVLAPVVGAGWWLVNGSTDPVRRTEVNQLPQYMTDLSAGRETGGVLYLRTSGTALNYQLLRQGSLKLGDDGIIANAKPDARLTRLVESIVTAGSPQDARRLASYGVSYVYAAAPVNPNVAGGIDASNGFVGASATEPGARAWKLEPAPDLAAVDRDSNPLHGWLCLAQVLAIIACVVGALPGRKLS